MSYSTGNVRPEVPAHKRTTASSDTKCCIIRCPARIGAREDNETCGDPVTVRVREVDGALWAVRVTEPCYCHHAPTQFYDTPYTLQDVQWLLDKGEYKEAA